MKTRLKKHTVFLNFSYVIIYEKGYQSSSVGLSSVTTKLKGTALTNLSIQFPVTVDGKNESGTIFDGPRIWDSSDYVIPPEVIAESI
jgi:hypothetical protein